MTEAKAAEYARVEAMEEISNRRDAVTARKESGQRIAMRNYANQNGFNPLPDSCKRFKHEFMLLAFTGPGYTRPCNPDVGVIFMGAFGVDGDHADAANKAVLMAKQFATGTIAPNFQGVDIRLVPMDKWTLIAKTPEAAADEAYCIKRMDDNMAAYYNILTGNQSKFKRRVEETVKSLQQQLDAAERALAEAKENLEVAHKEDTPEKLQKIAALKQKLSAFQKGEGVAMKEKCEHIKKKIRRTKKAITHLTTKHNAAELDMKIKKAHDFDDACQDVQLDGEVAFDVSEYEGYPIPTDSLETLEERATETKSYLDEAQAKLQKLESELEIEESKYPEIIDSMQSQIVYLENLSVVSCERQVMLCQKRYDEIRPLALKVVLHEKVEEGEDSRMPMKARQKKVEEEKIVTMGLPVDKVKQKKVSARLEARRNKIIDEMKDTQLLAPFPSYFLPRRQGCAAVCFLPDCDKTAEKGETVREPMVRVLKTYENKEEAEKDIQDNLSRYVTDFNIDVVDMGEWLFPECVDYDKIEKFQFRDVQQQEIMQSRRTEKKKVRDYETLCKEENLPCTELFIKEAEEGIPLEEYHRQAAQMQGTVEAL